MRGGDLNTGALFSYVSGEARVAKDHPLRAIGEKTIGLDRRAALPSYPGRTFQRWARKHASPPAARRTSLVDSSSGSPSPAPS